MLDIQIISASAGSGKTTRLAEVLEQSVVDDGVRPDAIVATTFTKKAAAELSERARRQLLGAGRVVDAQRLGAARIGTVNSVCDRLVSDFAFELGQPPQLDVLDEGLATEHLGRALGQVLPAARSRELDALGARMPGLDWRAQVWRLVETSRSNGLDDDALARCAERSLEGALAFLAPPAADGAVLDRALEIAFDAFIASGIDDTQGTRKAMNRAIRARAKLRAGQRLDWGEWASLATLAVGRQARELYAPVAEAAGAHDSHPALRADLSRAIELVFDVARRTRTAYAELKRSWGVIDFVDQEVLALSLLRRESVRARLREEIDLVLVDEFQDTSPLQLAIFLELARLAKRSIWVGDQKQAIYRFRGTDPALMNAALENLMADTDAGLVDRAVDEIVSRRQPETLTHSYRSRHELVRLTSEVFVPAFAGHGLPAERVRLEPALPVETASQAAALGPIVEVWPLTIPSGRRTSDLALAVAVGVRQLIDEAAASSVGTQVRDRETGALRARVPADIAVLCRTNTDCKRVAEALEEQGIAAVLPRVGLLDSAEGRLALAGLQRYVDPADRLAAAELARLSDETDDANAWLAQALGGHDEAEPNERKPDRFAATAAVVAVDGLRRRAPHLGALAALEALLSTLELARRCVAWGFAEQRLANLDALRAHAAAYEASAATRGLTPTPLGLLAYLLDLAEDSYGATREDRQATTDEAENAVTVSTWHRAKGLEWPVVVLFGLERLRQPSATGVYALGDRPSFDLDRPLDDRWVRFWPKPFHPNTQHAPYLERLRASSEAQTVLEEERREALRLLYVGWTRARDRLILAAQQGKLLGGMLGQLQGDDGALLHVPAIPIDDDGDAQAGLVAEHWAGHPVELFVRPLTPQPGPGLVASAGELWQHPTVDELSHRTHAPAFVAPSMLPKGVAATLRPAQQIGSALQVRGAAAPQALGQAMHGFLAAASSTSDTATRTAMAEHLLAVWDVEAHLSPSDLLAAAEALDGWIEARYPGAQRLCEWPLMQRLASGSCLRGVADLVLALADGTLVLVDHKTLVGAQAREHLGDYGGQLEAYAVALEAATGRKVRERFLHLPISAQIVELIAGP